MVTSDGALPWKEVIPVLRTPSCPSFVPFLFPFLRPNNVRAEAISRYRSIPSSGIPRARDHAAASLLAPPRRNLHTCRLAPARRHPTSPQSGDPVEVQAWRAMLYLNVQLRPPYMEAEIRPREHQVPMSRCYELSRERPPSRLYDHRQVSPSRSHREDFLSAHICRWKTPPFATEKGNLHD